MFNYSSTAQLATPTMNTKAKPRKSAQAAVPTEHAFMLFNEIGIINQLSSTRFQRALPAELSQAMFSVLNNFARLGGTRTPSQLAAAFEVTRGAMTNTLARLEALGCVRITPDPEDGRGKVVAMTAKGRRLRDSAIVDAESAFADIAAQLDPAFVEALIPELQKLRVLLDTSR